MTSEQCYFVLRVVAVLLFKISSQMRQEANVTIHNMQQCGTYIDITEKLTAHALCYLASLHARLAIRATLPLYPCSLPGSPRVNHLHLCRYSLITRIGYHASLVWLPWLNRLAPIAGTRRISQGCPRWRRHNIFAIIFAAALAVSAAVGTICSWCEL